MTLDAVMEHWARSHGCPPTHASAMLTADAVLLRCKCGLEDRADLPEIDPAEARKISDFAARTRAMFEAHLRGEVWRSVTQ